MSNTPVNNSNEETTVVRLMTIGDTTVGKTSMILRYTENMFQENHMATIGVDFKVKFIDVKDREDKNQRIKLQIWDTAGQERFHVIVKGYFQKADGIFVVFDLSKRDTFNKIRDFINTIEKDGNDHCAIVLVGNKSDLERSVSTEEAQQIADLNAIKYFETSAKENTNIDEAFNYLAQKAFLQKPPEKVLEKPDSDSKSCDKC